MIDDQVNEIPRLFIRTCSSKNSVCSQLHFAGLMVKKSLRQMPYSQAQSLFIIYGAENECGFSYTDGRLRHFNGSHRASKKARSVPVLIPIVENGHDFP